jgi:CNP1-like family
MNIKTTSVALLLSGLLTSNCIAQSGNGLDNPDWVEAPVPPAPALSQEPLLALTMPHHITSKVSVDPASIAVGSDGVVRYVVVMRNDSGFLGAVYEGIRCVSDEVKTYARMNSAGVWNPVTDPQWKPLSDITPARLSFVFARQGGCQNRLATSPREIIQALRQGGTAVRKGNGTP